MAISSAVSGSYKVPQATKSAVLEYFDYGNSGYQAFFQDTLKLKKGMEGYDRIVLLKPNTLPPWADLSEKDEKLADIKDLPTKTNLFKYLIQLAQDGYHIDLRLFTHGWSGQFGEFGATVGSEHLITASDITSRLSPAATGFTAMPIRTVWGTNCYGQTLGETWRSIGAKATAGARFVNFYPDSWPHFADDWNKGNCSFDSAVGNADTDLIRTASQLYIANIEAESEKKAGKWDGCPFPSTVLGDNPCAKDYFVSCWLAKDEWQAGMSGKDNMNYSSYMFRGGDKNITKNTRPSWA